MYSFFHLRTFLIAIFFLIAVIGVTIGYSSYKYYTILHSDDPIVPLLQVDMWSATIIRSDIAIDMTDFDQYRLQELDSIKTGVRSRATITWPDRSITRLGENTHITIQKMLVDRGYQKIQIAYNIERGKVWNTIIRGLLGDSYFEVYLPKNTIIAWVRWTTFEINLDSEYIYAISHAMQLRDISGRRFTLLPWELVDSKNIWVKKGKEWIDIAWSTYNTLSDEQYQKTRYEEVRNRIDILSGKIQSVNPLDFLARWILIFFEEFSILEISDLDKGIDISKLSDSTRSYLLEYYTSLSGKWFEKERDILRSVLIESLSGSSIVDDLRRQAFWDSVDSDAILPYSDRLFSEWKKEIWELINTMKYRANTFEWEQPLKDILNKILR